MLNNLLSLFLAIALVLTLYGGYEHCKRVDVQNNKALKKAKEDCKADTFSLQYKTIFGGSLDENYTFVDTNNSIEFGF